MTKPRIAALTPEIAESHIATLDDGTQVTVKDGMLHIFIPVSFKKRIGRKRIVSPLNPEPQGPLVTQIVRAFKWQKMLDEGEVASIADLSKRVGLSESILNRTLRFAMLAPDIVESILDGKEPSGMSVTKLRKITSSDLWSKQRERFFSQASSYLLSLPSTFLIK